MNDRDANYIRMLYDMKRLEISPNSKNYKDEYTPSPRALASSELDHNDSSRADLKRSRLMSGGDPILIRVLHREGLLIQKFIEIKMHP